MPQWPASMQLGRWAIRAHENLVREKKEASTEHHPIQLRTPQSSRTTRGGGDNNKKRIRAMTGCPTATVRRKPAL
eukprot:3361512-Prymnesium_polylepis.1